MITLIFSILLALWAAVRPGTQIIRRESPPPRSAPTDTTPWFVTGLTDRGPLLPQRIAGMIDFERIYGLRQSYSILYDALDVFFREGGGTVFVSRVVGPAAVSAFKNLLDAGAAVSLIATAKGPGAWANTYKVGVRAGSQTGYQIYIQDPNNLEVETSPDLTTQADAVSWSKFSTYINITLGASANVPAVAAPAVFATGTDDRVNATETDWTTALNRFTPDLGPGQVSAPGRTTAGGHAAVLAHAAAQNRIAILDFADTNQQATLLAAVVSDRVGNQRYGGGFAPWLVAPGYVPNTLRTVPPSSLVAARIAQVDPSEGPNQPAAGQLRGDAQYVIDVSQPAWDDPTRNILNNGGVNVIRNMFGGVRIYGWRSLVDPVQDSKWINLANARLYMAIVARAQVIAERYVLRKIDGAGLLMSAFQGDLTGMLMDYYDTGALYGATAKEAFIVDVGPTINTPTTLANNELHARLAVKMSPDAELVVIEIAKVAPNEVI